MDPASGGRGRAAPAREHRAGGRGRRHRRRDRPDGRRLRRQGHRRRPAPRRTVRGHGPDLCPCRPGPAAAVGRRGDPDIAAHAGKRRPDRRAAPGADAPALPVGQHRARRHRPARSAGAGTAAGASGRGRARRLRGGAVAAGSSAVARTPRPAHAACGRGRPATSSNAGWPCCATTPGASRPASRCATWSTRPSGTEHEHPAKHGLRFRHRPAGRRYGYRAGQPAAARRPGQRGALRHLPRCARRLPAQPAVPHLPAPGRHRLVQPRARAATAAGWCRARPTRPARRTCCPTCASERGGAAWPWMRGRSSCTTRCWAPSTRIASPAMSTAIPTSATCVRPIRGCAPTAASWRATSRATRCAACWPRACTTARSNTANTTSAT